MWCQKAAHPSHRRPLSDDTTGTFLPLPALAVALRTYHQDHRPEPYADYVKDPRLLSTLSSPS
jgi:hypothetical protein